MDNTPLKPIVQLFHYFSGNFFLFIIPLITFSILTRVLSTEQYGQMSLIDNAFSILSVIALCGLPQSAVRFFHPISSDSPTKYFSTYISGTFMTSVLFSGISLCGAVYIYLSNLQLSEYSSILILTSISIVPTNMIALYLSFYRASQKARIYNLITILNKGITSVAQILFIILFGLGIFGIYLANITVSVIICITVTFIFIHSQGHKVTEFLGNISKGFDKEYFKEAIRFGNPLVFAAVFSLLLTSGDRFLIGLLMGTPAVAEYSVGYNICLAMQSLIVGPINITFTPIILDIWNRHGREATSHFLSKSFKYYLAFCLPIVFFVISARSELVELLASDKYSGAEIVIPFVATAVLFYGAYFITWSGMQIEKKTINLMSFFLIAVLINLGLNVVLIPRIGLLGASISTLVSYVMFFVLTTWRSFKFLPFSIDPIFVIKALLLAIVLFVPSQIIKTQFLLLDIGIKAIVGIGLYLVFLFLIDSDVQHLIESTIISKIPIFKGSRGQT
jgi:O-antigen/teichoic acid export membrane protein